MKSRENIRKKTVKLKIEGPSNFRLIGISSHENDYRMVWAVNEQMKMQFTRVDNLLVHHVKIQADMEFSRFLYHDEDRYLKLYLISNRCPDGFLFPDVKNLDFLLQVTGEITDAELRELVKKLKSVSVISAVFILQADKIRGAGDVLQSNQ